MATYQTTIIDRKQIAKNTTEVSFKRPEDFSFEAGQYIQLGVNKLSYSDVRGASRVFSISSSPLDREKISVTFRDTGSGFKQTLKKLPENTPVKIEGPHGFYTFPKNSANSIIFIAGGIGITPYLSMIRFASKRRYTIPMTLIYINKDKENAAYLEELQDITDYSDYFTLKNRYERVNEQFIQQSVKNIGQHVWYIAGPPAMVDKVRNILYLLGVDSRKIYFEQFIGY